MGCENVLKFIQDQEPASCVLSCFPLPVYIDSEFSETYSSCLFTNGAIAQCLCVFDQVEAPFHSQMGGGFFQQIQIQRTMYSFKSPVDIDHELNTAHLFSDRFFFIKKDCLQYLPSLQLPWVGFNSAEHLRKVCIVDNNHYIPISLSLCGLNLHSKACVRHLICSKLLLRGRTQCEWFQL